MNYGFKCYSNNSEIINSKYFCDMCNNNNKQYFMKYNDSIKINSNITCYNSPDGYYLDKNDSLYKLCYKTCKSCNKGGNELEHNCIECKSDYNIGYMISNFKNCYNKNNFTGIDNVIINKSIFENNEEFLFSLTNKQSNNNIVIVLGICEDILKYENNILKNDSLYILQIIHKEIGMKIPKVKYELFYPLYNNCLTKLNLSLLQRRKVEISIPVKINDILDIYNASSAYYNDICCKIKSENGADISLKKRRNNFIKNNLTLCEENCQLIEYDYIQEKVKCLCDIKLSNNYDMKFNKNELYKNFVDKNNNIMKCYSVIFKKNEIIKNYGFFIILFIIIIYLITLFLFMFKSFNKIKKYIKYINNFSNRINKEENSKIEMIDINNCRQILPQIKKNININSNNSNNKENKNDIVIFNNEIAIKKKYTLGQISKNIDNESIKAEEEKSYGLGDLNNIYIKKYLNQKEFEINSLDYEEAITLDHRNYLQYYICLLKYNHPIMLSFSPYMDYNSRIIKIFLFFFLFNLCLDINVLFFNNNVIDKIYEDKGEYNFIFHFPNIIYSVLIIQLIDSLIKNLSLTQDNIVELKKQKEKKGFNNNDYDSKLIVNLKIKFISFFIISFIILISFSYYIICFCGVYENTQSHFIINSIISLIILLLLPFVTYLILGISRISALKAKNHNRRLLYKFCSFLEKLLR